MKKLGFTLLELLIVISILAILGTTVIVIINPIEFYQQSRDVKRISELKAIDKTISLAEFEQLFLGISSIVYISIPDNTSSVCANLGLPALPSGWSYSCKNQTDYRKIDGAGWIPIDFTRLSQGSFPVLPIDPVNAISSGQYYTYVTGGSWELTANLESSKYKGIDNTTGKDGGTSFMAFEIGNDLKLTPSQIEEGNRDSSLVGYWTLDENSGAVVYDSSGNGNDGTRTNAVWTTGKINSALSFDGNNDYVLLPAASSSLDIDSNPVTLIAWINPSSVAPGYKEIVGRGVAGGNGYGMNLATSSVNIGRHGGGNLNSNSILSIGSWYHVASVINGANSQIYINGVLDSTGSVDVTAASTNGSIGASTAGGASFFSGIIDDVRVYKRVLSNAEIKTIYEATK